MRKKKTSKLFSLDWLDAAKGLLVAAITAALTAILETLEAGTLTISWKKTLIVALVAGISYLIKNFLTPQKVVAKATNDDEGGERCKYCCWYRFS